MDDDFSLGGRLLIIMDDFHKEDGFHKEDDFHMEDDFHKEDDC